MAFAGPYAIHRDRYSRPSHRINSQVVGRGEAYENQGRGREECVVTIKAAAPYGNLLHTPVYPKLIPVTCRISTDTQPTVFQGEMGQLLGFDPEEEDVVLDAIVTPYGLVGGNWYKKVLMLSFGPAAFHDDYLKVEVWFPVQHGYHGWDWRFGFPQWNVLGMSNVLNRRMLCVTSDEVYAYEWLRPPS